MSSESEALTSNQDNHFILDNLPTEIQDVIFHYVVLDSTMDQLKLLRKCNRYFRERADIHLFHTLHISASTASLARLKQVSESDRLNIYVRELVFHRGTFFGHKMSRASRHAEVRARDFDDFETYVVQSSTRTATPVLLRISECYANFKEELGYESRFNQEMTWRWSLRKPCARFTRLEKLTTLTSDEDQESNYLRRRCALTHQVWTPNYFAPYEMFEVCGPTFKPKALSMDDVNGEDFAAIISNIRGGESAVAERFSSLKHLRLSFSETVRTLEVDGTWDVFIRSCSNLQSLSLGFDLWNDPTMLKESDFFPQKLIKIVLQQDFHQLASLDLSTALMKEQDFVSFLGRHQNSLSSLRLSNWHMLVDAAGLPTGSIIRGFWKIGKLPMSKLRSVQLQGEFSNGADGVGLMILSDGESLEEALARQELGKSLSPRHRWEAYLANGGSGRYQFPFAIDEGKLREEMDGAQLQAFDDAWIR